MNPLIYIRNLRVALDGQAILKGIDLDIEPGEIVSIIGPNGAGKTTLMRSLLGLCPYAGTLQIDGLECAQTPARKRARRISYVPQNHAQPPPLTVWDFVMLGRYPYLSPLAPARPEDVDAVERALEQTQSANFRDRRLNTLSGGERQKIHIAAALAQETPILLLDEPATFLDWRHQAEIMQLLHTIHRARRTTIVAVNHDLNNAEQLSSRIVALKEGRILMEGAPQKILQPAPLEQLFETTFTRQPTLTPHVQPCRENSFSSSA